MPLCTRIACVPGAPEEPLAPVERVVDAAELAHSTTVPERTDHVELGPPLPADGPALRGLALLAGGLDVNPTYAYALWVQEFASTTVVARTGGELVGYATGFRRPTEPSALFVWQMAVHPDHRGSGLARRMLHHLADAHAADAHPAPITIEATVAPGNVASGATFSRFAQERGAPIRSRPHFDQVQLGPGHDPEHLVRVGPIPVRPDAEAERRPSRDLVGQRRPNH
jgi:L-2,4-diaminobutyric acid acetyltransferase